MPVTPPRELRPWVRMGALEQRARWEATVPHTRLCEGVASPHSSRDPARRSEAFCGRWRGARAGRAKTAKPVARQEAGRSLRASHQDLSSNPSDDAARPWGNQQHHPLNPPGEPGRARSSRTQTPTLPLWPCGGHTGPFRPHGRGAPGPRPHVDTDRSQVAWDRVWKGH